MRFRAFMVLIPCLVAAGCDRSAPTPPAAPTPTPPAPPSAVVDPGDGRQPILPADLIQQPYKSVGRLINSNHPASWGTGTLIGPRHVLTAAHVVEHLFENEVNSGPATFILPDGRSSEVTNAEIDGGWKKKIVSCDFALLALKDQLGLGGAHAAWAEFDDDAYIGATLHISGYDADLWLEAGQPTVNVLYDRTTPIARLDKYKAEYISSPEVIIGGAGAAVVARRLKLTGPFLGAAALGLSYYGMKGYVLDQLGWSADAAVQAVGASGGPLWVDGAAGPMVVGVTGSAFKYGERQGAPFGRPVGSKLTPGACADMVSNFIRSNP